MNPNRDNCILFYRYNFSHLTGDPTHSWKPIEIKPANKPYKFEFDQEDKFIKKQLKTKGLVSYLYYQDGKVLMMKFHLMKLGNLLRMIQGCSMKLIKSVMSYILGHAICDGYDY